MYLTDIYGQFHPNTKQKYLTKHNYIFYSEAYRIYSKIDQTEQILIDSEKLKFPCGHRSI